MVAEKKLPEPKTIVVTEVLPNKALLGKTFKKDAKAISDALANLSEQQISDAKKQLDQNG